MTELKTRTSWQVYKRLISYARPYKIRLWVGIIAGLLSSGMLLGILQASQMVFLPFGDTAPREVKTGSGLPSKENTKSKWENQIEKVEVYAGKFGIEKIRDENGRPTWQVIVISLLFLPVLVAGRAATIYLNAYYMRWVGSRVVRSLRDDLFDRLQSQSLKFFGKSDVGQLISSCTNDATVVENVVAAGISDVSRAPLEILAALIFVVAFSIQNELGYLVGVMSLVFPLCIIPIIVLGRYVKRFTHRALEGISDLVSRMHENFTGIRVVKAYHMERKEYGRFVAMNEKYFKSVIKALRSELFMTPLMEGVAILLGCIFFVVCYARGVRLDQIIPIGLAAVVAYRPLKRLAQFNANIQRGAAALDRIYRLLDTDMILKEAPNPVILRNFKDRIIFENVDFKYDEDTPPVLTGINLVITKGEVIAIVGETGSGKTTMANLLARFYDPTGGRILFDGVDLRESQTASLRKMIGVVTQETIIFNDTIASNISYGTENVTHEQIVAAAKEANAHEFIMADPQGYERLAGEKGFVLSGGERQRIAIARAILKNPPILILDEATSALDTVTERLVQEAISRVMKDRTVFAIAHRLSTVRHADRIVLLDKGRIVEQGSHEELYNAGGRYRKLCDTQLLEG